jgi:hypothetical protein
MKINQHDFQRNLFQAIPFVWAKLLLGLATVAISAIILAILLGIAWLFKSEGVGAVMFFVWLILAGIVRFAINHYIGFLVKAGHIAVITVAVTTGSVPNAAKRTTGAASFVVIAGNR